MCKLGEALNANNHNNNDNNNKQCVDKFNGRRRYIRLKLNYYRLRLWAPTSSSRAISTVSEFLVLHCHASHTEISKYQTLPNGGQ